MTGFPIAVRALIIERACGLCELCGTAKPGMQVHHRRARKMGGSRLPETNLPANGLYVCGADHSELESRRELAYSMGWLVRQHETPAHVPVLRRGEWVMLADDGSVTSVEDSSGVVV